MPNETIFSELHLNFDELESMFSCASVGPGDTPTVERRSSRKNDVIALLSYKRSFNVSIFLKQFKEGIPQIVENVREGHGGFFGLERLNNLRAVLPDSEEVEILRSFSGDPSQLGIAEQFFMSLLAVPDYRLKLDCMILKEELDAAFETLLPQIDTVINACIEIKGSEALPKIFCMLVQIGNFLNANAVFGNAAGFRLNSLWKILDMKAAEKSITLLHFISMQDSECAEKLLKELSTVPAAARLSLESIRSDVRALGSRLSTVSNEVAKRTDSPFFEEANQHFMNSRDHMENMEERLEQMNSLISYLAAYFCEEEKQFKVEECFKILFTFTCRLRDALKDNEARLRRQKCHEERANVQNVLAHSSSEHDLSKNATNTKTLFDLLESNAHVDGRHCRSRSNIIGTANIVIEKASEDDREERKVVHRTVRKLRNELPDEADDMSPIVKLRRESRNKSDAYLLRNSQNLDDFLEAAERVEKEAARKHAEHTTPCLSRSKEAPQELIELPSILITSAGDVSKQAPPTNASMPTRPQTTPQSTSKDFPPEEGLTESMQDATASTADDGAPITPGSAEKMKRRVAVERASMVPLSRTRPRLNSIRTQKSFDSKEKTTPQREVTENSPLRTKAPQPSSAHYSKSAHEKRSITKPFVITTLRKSIQPSPGTTSASRKTVQTTSPTNIKEQTSNTRLKSTQSKSAPLQNVNTIKETKVQKLKGNQPKTEKKVPTRNITIPRTRSGNTPGSTRCSTPTIPLTNSPSTSLLKNTVPGMPEKLTVTHTQDVHVPTTSNPSVENSPPRRRAVHCRGAYEAKENSFGGQLFWGPVYRASSSSHAKTATSKGVLHSRENTPRPATAPHQNIPSSTSSITSRPKSSPHRTHSSATPPTRVSPTHTAPSTPGRTIKRGTTSGPQPTSAPVGPSPHSRTMKRTESCSTASRPALIKTGSISRPEWR